MKGKAFLVVLAILILLALQGSQPQTAVSAPPSKDLDLLEKPLEPAQSTTCNTCSDCNAKLTSGDYITVTLTTDLMNLGGGCIALLYPEHSDLVFDCAGHTIDGDDIAIDPEQGIVMLHGDNNTVMNCTVSDFSSGIYFGDATNHTAINNNLTSNGIGIRLSGASASDIRNNTSTENYTGIVLENADNNAIYDNVVCSNTTADFNISTTSTGNSGDNNTCDLPDGWNDAGTTGCTSLCTGSTTCNSCVDCTNKLNGLFDRVVLTANVNNHSGTCITFGASNVEFNCDGHTLDGDDSGTDYGVSISGYSGNTVRQCTITDFYRGLYLSNADNNTLTWNTVNSNIYDGIYLSGASGNDISWSGIDSNGQYGISLYNSPSNTVYANDLQCNNRGIRLNGSNSNTINLNDVCSSGGDDFTLVGGSSGNSGDNNTCDAPDGWNDTGTSGCTSLCNSDRCATCSDGVRNGDEDDVDCGGTYCPPCSQCADQPATKYAPADTVCDDRWPTSDGPKIGMNNSSDSCNLVEVCDPNLDYIIEDALLCCEHTNYSALLTGNRASSKVSACNYAHSAAYNNSFTGNFNPTTLDQCLAHYLIGSFGSSAVYMQNYFDGELCCHGSDHCPSSCSEWCICPPAWEMGTAASCAGPDGATPDFQMGGHNCEYYWTWIFTTIRWGKDGYWHSDTSWQSNNDSFADIPAHASINQLSTGTCVDYSFALTTMLRKAGYSYDDILSVNGEGHGYNLLRFPNESKWHYVDTVGNNGGGVYGGSGWPDPEGAWYSYCRNMDDGCSNDVHSESRGHCPPNSAIYGCESVLMAAADAIPWSTPAPQAAPALLMQPGALVQADEECTELNPCTGTYTTTVEAPGVQVDLDVYQTLDRQEITLGQGVLVSITLVNKENKSVDAVVQLPFIPDVAYDLRAKERSYEAFTFQYHAWDVTVPPQGVHVLSFTATPEGLGHYALLPASAFVGGHVYRSTAPVLTVVCEPDGTCGAGESYRYCPKDCTTGIQDDYCDALSDKRIDPDCAYGVDPDGDPEADTDGDGVMDGQDDCPLTPDGAVVDANGCACSQKICDDEDPLTEDSCNAQTAACEHSADSDQDGVPDSQDNCPDTYNPEQHDTDTDGTGDQCEIPPIDADTTLDGGTYYVYDYAVSGAVVITASDVTLDCAGATLIGDGTGYGIYVPESVQNVTVQNCHVRHYRYGIYVDRSGGHQLLDNTLQQNSYGIVLGEAANNTLSGNMADANTYAGIYLEGASGNQVLGNTMHSNENLGLFIHTSSDNDISGNSVCNNTNTDLAVYDSSNTGDDNACDEPGDWNDAGTTGCSRVCMLNEVYLPLVLRNYP